MGGGLKKVIVELLQEGYSRKKISTMFNVPKSNVIDICRKFSDTGSVENKPKADGLRKPSPVTIGSWKGS